MATTIEAPRRPAEDPVGASLNPGGARPEEPRGEIPPPKD